MTWIQTLDGAAFDLLDPDQHLIDPHTIGVCLARTCRFKGHCSDFYSVAQHSLIVCDFVLAPELKLAGLLHDAHEVYTGFGDIARPAKYLNNDVRRFLKAHERLVDVQIAARFGFPDSDFLHDQIGQADALALSTERRDVMGPCEREWEELPPPSPIIRIEPMNIDEAYRHFMARLHELLAENETRRSSKRT
jgi:hypothetical protein